MNTFKGESADNLKTCQSGCGIDICIDDHLGSNFKESVSVLRLFRGVNFVLLLVHFVEVVPWILEKC